MNISLNNERIAIDVTFLCIRFFIIGTIRYFVKTHQLNIKFDMK